MSQVFDYEESQTLSQVLDESESQMQFSPSPKKRVTVPPEIGGEKIPLTPPSPEPDDNGEKYMVGKAPIVIPCSQADAQKEALQKPTSPPANAEETLSVLSCPQLESNQFSFYILQAGPSNCYPFMITFSLHQ